MLAWKGFNHRLFIPPMDRSECTLGVSAMETSPESPERHSIVIHVVPIGTGKHGRRYGPLPDAERRFAPTYATTLQISSKRILLPRTLAAFCNVLRVIAPLSGSRSRFREARLVFIRFAISDFVRPD